MEHEIEVFCDWLDEETDEYGENCYEATFEFSAYYTPARINCRVEDSCPEEGDSSFEITSLTMNGTKVDIDNIDSEDRKQIYKEVSEWVDENGLEYIAEYNEECRADAMADAAEFADDFYYDRGY